jgi:effector-binding domain-containing protein
MIINDAIGAGIRAQRIMGEQLMLSTPEIVRTDARMAAVIRLTIPRNEMPKQFGPAIGEVMAAIAAQKIAATGSVFAHHLTMTADRFDFEVGVPVAARIEAAGRVQPSELRAASVARAIYSGGYEGLPAAWGQFTAWLNANGHVHAPDLWEVYTVGPQSTPDPAGWRTELNRPLAE